MKTLTKLATAAALATAVAGTAVQAEPVKTTTNDPFASTQVFTQDMIQALLLGSLTAIVTFAATDGT